MTTLAIEINDVGLRGRTATGELFDSPGFALVDGAVVTGERAYRQARVQPGRVHNDFWNDLSLESLPSSARGAATIADLAYQHLGELWSDVSDAITSVLLVVPGHYTREQLSLLLGIARECGMPVAGLVDLALAAARQPAAGRQLMHVELMLHQVVLTRLAQGRRLRREQVATVADAGQLALRDAWARAVSDVFVRNTRFDPMHSAESEQQFYDGLPDWVRQIDRDGSTEITLRQSQREHTIEVGMQTLVDAGQPVFRRLVRHIAATTRPGEQLTLWLSDRLGDCPGLHAALREGMPGAETVDLAPGAAAIGALRREAELAAGGEAVAYVTSVGWDAATIGLTPPSATRPPAATPPTHVVYAGRAWPIDEGPLVFGVEPQHGERSVVVTTDGGGVSRRHCSLRREGLDVIVTDLGRFGTYLNGRRIDGESTAHYGDLVRLGASDQLLLLVALQDDDGG